MTAPTIQAEIEKMPEMPSLPIQYQSKQSPFKENAQIRWYMDESAALRARLRLAAEILQDMVNCEFDVAIDPLAQEATAILDKLRSEGLA